MKKLIFPVIMSIVFMACSNDKKTTPAIVDTTSSSMAADAMKNDAKAEPVDTSAAMATVPATGDMMMKNGKMMVMKDGQWVEMKETLSTSNGTQVMSNGHVMMSNGTNRMMTEGEIIKLNGDILDKEGKLHNP